MLEFIATFVVGALLGIVLGWFSLGWAARELWKTGKFVIEDGKLIPAEKTTEKCPCQACQHPYDSRGDRL